MTQFTEAVEKRRLMIEAEKWAEGVVSMHGHRLKSMWYDTRPEDTDNSGVLDIEYNSGLIKRTIIETGEVVYFGEQLSGEKLLNAYLRKG